MVPSGMRWHGCTPAGVGTGVGAVTGTGTAAAAGGSVAAGVAAPGLTIAAGTGTGVTGTTGAAVTAGTAVVVTAAGGAAGTNAPPGTGAGVAAGLAAAVATGVAGGAGVWRGARLFVVAIVVEEAVAGVMLREDWGGGGLAPLPMPKVFRRPPKKSSGGKAGIMPGCALIGWLHRSKLTQHKSRTGCDCAPIHLCCLLLPW